MELSTRIWRFGFTATLVTSMAICPFIVYGLTALSPLIVHDLNLSRTQFGALASGAFAVAMAGSITSGRMVDCFGGRRILYALCAFSALSMLLVASGTTYVQLVLAVALSGVGIAFGNPATNQLISTYLPAGDRGKAVGLKQAGVPLSQLIAGLALPAMALMFGWRSAIGIWCCLSVFNLVLSVAFIPKLRPMPSPEMQLQKLPKDVWWLLVYSLLTGVAVQATNVYLPLFAHERLDFSIVTGALIVAIVGGIGLSARIAWGAVSDAMTSPQLLLAVLAFAAAFGSSLLWVSGLIESPALFWLGVIVHGSTAIAMPVVVIVVLVRVVDQAKVGKASGIIATGQFAGFSVGPLALGAVADSTGSYLIGWFSLATLYCVVCIVSVIKFRGSGCTSAVLWRWVVHPVTG